MRKTVLIQMAILLLVCFCINCSTKKEQQEPLTLNAGAPAIADVSFEDDSQIIDDGISQSRQNAITRAVTNVSPAVVGINVVQIRRYVQRSPFEDDPFWRYFYPRREFEQRVKGLGSGFIISP